MDDVLSLGTKLQLLAGGVVDEGQQCAGLATTFEPAVLTAVDLHKLTVTLSPKPPLVKGLRCLRDSQSPASIIHLRNVSRET